MPETTSEAGDLSIGSRASSGRLFLRGLARSAFDVLLPPLCLACQTRVSAHDTLCPCCWKKIDFIRAPLCDRLGLPLPYDTGGTMNSAAAAANPPRYDRARAVARYDGLMRDLIHDFKFGDCHNGKRLFGRWLAEAGHELLVSADVIVPVPLARFRLLTRRFNQAQILAAETARLCAKPVSSFLLSRVRSTPRQVGLSRLQRQRNVAGAFEIPPRRHAEVAGKAIVLVDDVITTGSTASAAAATLKRAGAARVDVLALALVANA